MAKVASAFPEFPGLEAILKLQRKLDMLYDPPLMRQLDAITSMQRQFSDSLRVYESLRPEVLSSAAAIAQAWPTVTIPDALVDVLSNGLMLESALAPTIPFAAAHAELQAALSAHMLDWSAISDAVQSSSLVRQKEYAINRVCTLVGEICDVADVGERFQIDLTEEFSKEDEQIIADEVSSIVETERNWEQRLVDSAIKIKEKHPALFGAWWQIIMPLLIGILGSLIATKIYQANTSAKVYDKPNTTAPVVYHLEPHQQVLVVGEQPYYYQIEIQDGETNETLIGFVSKRSLKLEPESNDEVLAGSTLD